MNTPIAFDRQRRQIKRAVQGIFMANTTPLESFEAQNVEVLWVREGARPLGRRVEVCSASW